MPHSNCRQRRNMLKKNGIKKNLWTVTGSLGGIAQFSPLRVRRRLLPVEFISHQARYIDKITRVIFWPSHSLDLISNTPATAKLHRAGGELAHFRNGNASIPLFHEQAVNPLEPKLSRQCETDRSAAADENRECVFVRVQFFIVVYHLDFQ